ncbi:hypothetical protein SODG_003179 [Sodalis praecaptivus]|nr:hypothetical protein NVIRENTERO_04028 [Sodalis praecaptivus]
MNATANAGVRNYADVAAIHSVTAAVNANAEVAQNAEVAKERRFRIGRTSG